MAKHIVNIFIKPLPRGEKFAFVADVFGLEAKIQVFGDTINGVRRSAKVKALETITDRLKSGEIDASIYEEIYFNTELNVPAPKDPPSDAITIPVEQGDPCIHDQGAYST